MNQRQQVLDLFRENGGSVTLGQILKTTLSAEYRARFSDLRRENYRIVLTRGETPSKNLYTLQEPAKFDETGQGLMFGGAR